jgi:hypothetical protein
MDILSKLESNVGMKSVATNYRETIYSNLQSLNHIIDNGQNKTVVEFIMYCHSLYKNNKTDEKYVEHVMKYLSDEEKNSVINRIKVGVKEARTPTKVTKSNILDLASLIYWTNEYVKSTDQNDKKIISTGLMDILSKLESNVGLSVVTKSYYTTISNRNNPKRRGRKPGQTKKQEISTDNDVSDSDIETSQTQDTQPRKTQNPDLPDSIKKSVPESRSAVLKGILAVL